MKALVQKEIRLLGPAYGLALFLAIVPVWLLPEAPGNTPAALSLFPFWFGAMMLALSAFGREFGLGTFPLILAQPLERNRIWRTKVAVLAGAMASAFAAWCLSCAACVRPGMGRTFWLETLTIGGTTAMVSFAGGLWTTLLLRQMAAAFWFTILVPDAIGFAIETLGGSDAMVVAALGLYSILGFFWARRLFFRFQEAGWTGGVISFPGWRKEHATLQPALRTHGPLAALFWKELQLQQVSLAGIGCLFLMHLGVAAIRRFGQDSLGDALRLGLEVFGGVWLIVALLVGSSSVAEERKLGATPEHLCLPVSSRLQYVLKLLFVLALGGVLSGLLLWTAEGIGSTVRGNSSIEAFKTPFQVQTLEVSTLICLGLSLIGFYASTLTRSIVQALAAAVALAAGVWVAGSLAAAIAFGNLPICGIHLWRGCLVFYIGLPTLVAAFVALAYRNFRRGSADWCLWRHNLAILAGALLLVATLTTATYHRAWELVTPLDRGTAPTGCWGRPQPGLPERRLQAAATSAPTGHWSQPQPGPCSSTIMAAAPCQPCCRMAGFGWTASAMSLAGLILAFGESTGFRVGGKWGSVSGNQIEPGSNWVAVAATFTQTVAIRADGTLWVSEKPRLGDSWNGVNSPTFEEAAPLVRFGQETNWQSVDR